MFCTAAFNEVLEDILYTVTMCRTHELWSVGKLVGISILNQWAKEKDQLTQQTVGEFSTDVVAISVKFCDTVVCVRRGCTCITGVLT